MWRIISGRSAAPAFGKRLAQGPVLQDWAGKPFCGQSRMLLLFMH